MKNQFETLPLLPDLIKTLKDLDFQNMTTIQERALPLALEGHDLLAQAKTGSGKTAVFGLTILNTVNIDNLKPQSLVLCPTRELAEQVAKEVRTFGRLLKNLRVLSICGGVAQIHQEKSLEHGAHIIIGTPGRVLRLLKEGHLNLDGIQSFILDEADKMLEMGFKEDIIEIKNRSPERLQTLLFSATFPEEIKDLGEKLQNDAIRVEGEIEHDIDAIEQVFYRLESHKKKNEALLGVIQNFKLSRLIVFCKTKRISDDVAIFLNKKGILAASIHGDLQQNERTAVLTKFSNNSLCALVATDVAARGLDIEGIPAVVNYDLPQDSKVYVHRIGRTARAGASGSAYSFFVEQEEHKLEEISELIGFTPETSGTQELLAAEEFIPSPPMDTIYISGGKKDKLRAGDIVGALIHEAKLEASDIGDIAVLNIITLVALKHEKAQQAITALSNGKIKKRKFKVGFA